METSVDVIKLKMRMVEMGFDTNSQLADTAKIDRNTLGKILKGKILPSADMMYKLIYTLKLPPSDAGEIFFNSNLRNM